MKTPKKLLILTLLFSFGILLTACGGSEQPAAPVAEEAVSEPDPVEEEPTEAPSEAATEEETAVEVDAETVTLTIWADENRAGPIREFGAQFEEDFGVTLVVEEFGFGDIRDQTTVTAPAGEGADIIVGAHDWLGELVTNGLLAPIDLGDRATEFAPAALQAFTFNGELYGLPYATENVALFRNPDLVADAPQTWDEVLTISRDLAADNGENVDENQYGFVLMEGNSYHIFPLLTAYDGYVFAQNADGTYDPSDIGIGSEGSIAGADVYYAMIQEGLIPPAMDGDTMVSWFEEGKAAMMITGPWNLSRIRESGVNYEIDPIPTGTTTGRPFLGSQGFMINSFSQNPLLSQIFVTEFIASTDLMQAFYEVDPRTPAYLPVLETLDDQDIVSFASAGELALPMPAIPEMGAVWQAWGNAITLIGQQTEDPQTALTIAQEQIQIALTEGESGESMEEDESGPLEIEMVNIPGTLQEAIGCGGNWDPACEASALAMGDDGVWSGTFDLPAGDYEVKVAINGGWDINYGVDGVAGGDNLQLSLSEDAATTFSFDPTTNLLSISTE